MHAAKIMAATAAELYSDPEHLQKIRQEFEDSTHGEPYEPPVPDDPTPIRYHPEG